MHSSWSKTKLTGSAEAMGRAVHRTSVLLLIARGNLQSAQNKTLD